MAYIKSEIDRLTKEAKGKKHARMISEQWFEDAMKSRADKNVELTPKPFKPGMIYVFDYKNPKYKEDLEWWDKRPVVLALYPLDSYTDCGINLNLLPVKFKETLLDKFYQVFHAQIDNTTKGIKREDAMKQRALAFRYENIKGYLDKFGFGFAVRRYKNNLKRNQAIVSYESWGRIALCDFIKLNGSNVAAVRRMFAKYYSGR